MPESEFPKEIELTEVDKWVGYWTVVWRKDGKETAKILGTFKDGEDTRVRYELTTGPEAGQRFNAKFDPSQKVTIYDKGTLILAPLDQQ